MSAKDFDAMAAEFTQNLRHAADWKSNFAGAAYSTRIAAAILCAECALDGARRLLEDDRAAISPTPRGEG